MPTLQETLDSLRGRLVRARNGMPRWRRPWAVLAPEMGLSRPTVLAFIEGRTVTTTSLELIEAWLQKEEQRRLAEENPYV